jgi:hypothetical protein
MVKRARRLRIQVTLMMVMWRTGLKYWVEEGQVRAVMRRILLLALWVKTMTYISEEGYEQIDDCKDDCIDYCLT